MSITDFHYKWTNADNPYQDTVWAVEQQGIQTRLSRVSGPGDGDVFFCDAPYSAPRNRVLPYHARWGFPDVIIDPTVRDAPQEIAADPLGVWATQIGGSHYTSCAIQPFEYSMQNGLDPLQHTVVKYVTRFRDKGGVEDLKKAKHCIDLLIEWETRKEKTKNVPESN